MYLSDYILCGDYSDEPGTPDEINERLQEVFGGTILEEAIKKVGGEKFLSNLIDNEKAERIIHDKIGDNIHLLSPEQQKKIKMHESFMATVRRIVLEKHLK
ncbi:MAG: hypothetical protein J6X49_12860 [Victivallales bacterium]|nr:hypothetical protein [Victivallales bacterium]